MKQLTPDEYKALQAEVFRLAGLVAQHAQSDLGFELVVTRVRPGYFAGMSRAGNLPDSHAAPMLREAADVATNLVTTNSRRGRR